jgi:hypothetical protein
MAEIENAFVSIPVASSCLMNGSCGSLHSKERI